MDNQYNNNQSSAGNNNGGNNKTWVWVLVAILLIVGILMVTGAKKNGDMTGVNLENSGQTTDMDDTNMGEDTNADGVNESDAASAERALTYSQALKQYQGKTVQFDATCQANPDRQVFKTGTSIMLDNRSNVSRSVKLGSTYTLGAYGFRIVKLNTLGTFNVDCGTSQNVATITVEK